MRSQPRFTSAPFNVKSPSPRTIVPHRERFILGSYMLRRLVCIALPRSHAPRVRLRLAPHASNASALRSKYCAASSSATFTSPLTLMIVAIFATISSFFWTSSTAA